MIHNYSNTSYCAVTGLYICCDIVFLVILATAVIQLQSGILYSYQKKNVWHKVRSHQSLGSKSHAMNNRDRQAYKTGVSN